MYNFSESINIGSFTVGHEQPVFIIAEAGVAHFGSVDRAKQLVDMAVAANADAVKFQIFRTEDLISPVCPEWRERLKPKELEFSAFLEIKTYCEQKGILFLATAHDEKSFEYLVGLDVAAYKVGSGEVDNGPFLKTILSQNKPVLLSTGLHNKESIQNIVKLARQVNNPNLILLHCNTAYPTPIKQSNLRSICWMRDHFKTLVGYSDHTVGMTVPLAAVALGACVIEKHICLEKFTEGSQDCKVACKEVELIEFVKAIRDTEQSMGHYDKHVIKEAEASVLWARKSIVADKDLQPGHIVTAEDIKIRRPGTGIAPGLLDKVLGKRLIQEVSQDCLIQWEDLECQSHQEKSAS